MNFKQYFAPTLNLEIRARLDAFLARVMVPEDGGDPRTALRRVGWPNLVPEDERRGLSFRSLYQCPGNNLIVLVYRGRHFAGLSGIEHQLGAKGIDSEGQILDLDMFVESMADYALLVDQENVKVWSDGPLTVVYDRVRGVLPFLDDIKTTDIPF